MVSDVLAEEIRCCAVCDSVCFEVDFVVREEWPHVVSVDPCPSFVGCTSVGVGIG